MTATISPQAKAPIPPGRHNLGTCPACGPAEYVISVDGDRGNVTCSQDPGPDGRHQIHAHHDWCPVLTGETPEVACPMCGAPVFEYDVAPGVVLTIPGAGPNLTDGHWVGTTDDPGYAKNNLWASKREPAPSFDKVTVKPCGHEHKGGQGHAVLLALRTVHAAHATREAEALFAEYAAVTDAAEAAGHIDLVLRWQGAVRTGSPEAIGLLAALRVVGAR